VTKDASLYQKYEEKAIFYYDMLDKNAGRFGRGIFVIKQAFMHSHDNRQGSTNAP
jgi:hypothetical protein